MLQFNWFRTISSEKRAAYMKQKTVCLVMAVVVIVIALLSCLIAYFRPLSFSDVAEVNEQITIISSELGGRVGEPYIDTVDYQSLTTEQKSAVLALLGQYTYRRTLGTPFSDGSMSGLGNRTLSIYTYDGMIFVSATGKVAVNGKNYRMRNAEQFIEQILEIVA